MTLKCCSSAWRWDMFLNICFGCEGGNATFRLINSGGLGIEKLWICGKWGKWGKWGMWKTELLGLGAGIGRWDPPHQLQCQLIQTLHYGAHPPPSESNNFGAAPVFPHVRYSQLLRQTFTYPSWALSATTWCGPRQHSHGTYVLIDFMPGLTWHSRQLKCDDCS